LDKSKVEFKTLPEITAELLAVLNEISKHLSEVAKIRAEVEKMHREQSEFFRFLREKGLKTRGV